MVPIPLVRLWEMPCGVVLISLVKVPPLPTTMVVAVVKGMAGVPAIDVPLLLVELSDRLLVPGPDANPIPGIEIDDVVGPKVF